MQEIKKIDNGTGYDEFHIETNEGVFEISFQGNLDLYWNYRSKEIILDKPNEKEFIITKENYYIYELFYKLYESIKNRKVYCSYNDEEYIEVREDEYNPCKLFKDGIIDWHSDDNDYENASRLLIKKEDEIFRVTFIKSKKENDIVMPITYSVRFSNSGSRYNPYNIAFMNMYNELKLYDTNYHQMHIEEYLYNQKLLKKKF